MATAAQPLRIAAPLRRSCRALSLRTSTLCYPPRRHFLSAPNPFDTFQPPIQNLHASRTLPYPSTAIYSIIADVSSYSSFLPYCHSSKVTRWSAPDTKSEKKWPSEAQLEVGWGSITEKFTSRIYCVPGEIVEATAGQTKSTLERGTNISKTESAEPENSTTASSNTQHSDASSSETPNPSSSSILTHLLTRWTLRPFPYQPSHTSLPDEGTSIPPKEHTEVSLSIEFRFANPIYSTMSAAVAPRVAGVLIEAFEGRVRSVMDGQGIAGEQGKTRLGEGVTEGVVGGKWTAAGKKP